MNYSGLLLDIEQLKKLTEEVKQRFATSVKDKSVPLDERWKFWCEAPDFLKEQEPWIQHFDIEDKVGEFHWYNIGYDKYSTVYMSDIVENIEDNIDHYNESCFLKFTPELLVEFKEEILETNLGSFINDW